MQFYDDNEDPIGKGTPDNTSMAVDTTYENPGMLMSIDNAKMRDKENEILEVIKLSSAAKESFGTLVETLRERSLLGQISDDQADELISILNNLPQTGLGNLKRAIISFKSENKLGGRRRRRRSTKRRSRRSTKRRCRSSRRRRHSRRHR